MSENYIDSDHFALTTMGILPSTSVPKNIHHVYSALIWFAVQFDVTLIVSKFWNKNFCSGAWLPMECNNHANGG